MSERKIVEVRLPGLPKELFCPVCGAVIFKGNDFNVSPCAHLVLHYGYGDLGSFPYVSPPYRKLVREALAAAHIPKVDWGDFGASVDPGGGNVKAAEDAIAASDHDANAFDYTLDPEDVKDVDPLKYVLERIDSPSLVWLAFDCGGCGFDDYTAIVVDFQPRP